MKTTRRKTVLSTSSSSTSRSRYRGKTGLLFYLSALSGICSFGFAVGEKQPEAESCRFSNDGKYALVFEYTDLRFGASFLPLFVLYDVHSALDSVLMENDSIHVVHWDESSMRLVTKRSLAADDYYKEYDLFEKGTDISSSIEFEIDSVYQGFDYPLVDSRTDTSVYKGHSFLNIISYNLDGKTEHRDTVKCFNTSVSKQLDVLQRVEPVYLYDKDSVLKGTRSLTKIFSNKERTHLFIRTTYIDGTYDSRPAYHYEGKYYPPGSAIVATKTGSRVEVLQSSADDERAVRKLISKTR